MKARSLHELAALRAELRCQREAAVAEARRRDAEALEAERQRQLFSLTVGPVNALSAQERALIDRARPEPLPRQREADEQAALRASLSDEIDIEALLLTDDGLSFRRPTIALDVVN